MISAFRSHSSNNGKSEVQTTKTWCLQETQQNGLYALASFQIRSPTLRKKLFSMCSIFAVIIFGALQEALCIPNFSLSEGSTRDSETDVSSEDCHGIKTLACKIYFFNDPRQNIQHEFRRNSSYEIISRTKPRVTDNGTEIFCEASHRTDKNCSSHIDYFGDQRNGTKCLLLFYEVSSYSILNNGSAVVDGHYVVDGIVHKFINNTVYECADMYDINSTNDFRGPSATLWMTYVSYVGSGLSVVSLLIYLVVYMCTPKLKNLPGYILTSMNISLLLAYSFSLISQLSQVVGTPCVLSAIFLHYFFLASFFWMSVLSYDVWRTLNNATKKLLLGSNEFKVRFACYSIYAWGIPLVLKIAATVVHYHPNSPEHMVPVFGNDTCMFSNYFSRVYFYVIPSTTILVGNTLLYILSVIIIVGHKMKDGKRESSAKKRFMLHLRFGIFMGLTWVLGIFLSFPFLESEILDFIYIVLNSTQGIFISVLFCCTEKVSRHGSMRLRSLSRSSIRRTNVSSNA